MERLGELCAISMSILSSWGGSSGRMIPRKQAHPDSDSEAPGFVFSPVVSDSDDFEDLEAFHTAWGVYTNDLAHSGLHECLAHGARRGHLDDVGVIAA